LAEVEVHFDIIKMALLRWLLLPAALFFAVSHCSVDAISKVTPADWAALNASVNGRLFSLRPLAFPCYTSYNGVAKPVDTKACADLNAKKTNVEYIAAQAGGLIQACSPVADACAHGRVCEETL
jgi:hypothetical protein